MLRLIIDEKDQKVQSATVPLRWCVDKSDLEALKKEKIINPYVLIVTVANGREMTRQLAPLDQMLAYVQFRRPGKNTIFAAVISDYREDAPNKLWSRYMRKEDGRYATDVVDEEGNFLLLKRGYVCIPSAEIDAVVPDDLFAPEPPEWEQEWVNLLFDPSPRDQCDYRKRRIFAYALQPILVAVWLILKLTIGLTVFLFLFLLCGMRQIWFRPLFHPFSAPLESVWEDRGRTIFRPRVGTGYRRINFLLPFSPVYWLLFYGLFAWIFYDSFPGKGLGYSYLVEAFYPTLLCIVASIIFLAAIDILEIILDRRSFKKRERSDIEREYALEQKYEFDLQALACDHADLKPRLDALPKSRRTIYLRFWDLKARVCRPFAR